MILGPGSADGFVGVLDSGVGGISVLRACVAQLPHEDFRFFGDSANAPYGEKTPDEVLALTRATAERIVAAGAKAMVIACNTATSAAAPALRADYPDLPIIGVEPALKPAVEAVAASAAGRGRILVMATPMTLQLEKYQELVRAWGHDAEVVSVPCPGLAARIEKGALDAPDLEELVRSLVGEYAGSVDAAVLGCTHYPFIRPVIARVLGEGVRFFDGREGTARHLRRRLTQEGLLATRGRAGAIEFTSSLDTAAELALYRRFYELPL